MSRVRPRRSTSTSVLKKKSVYIIDDTETFGKGVADAFEKEFVAEGGTVVKHDAAPKTTQDYVSIMTAAKALNPESIYFGGVTATGGARILLAAAAGRPRRRPVRRPGRHQRRLRRDEGLVPEPRRPTPPRTRTARSPASATFPGKAQFDADYKTEYGIDATGYAGRATPAPRSSSTRSTAPAPPARPT